MAVISNRHFDLRALGNNRSWLPNYGLYHEEQFRRRSSTVREEPHPQVCHNHKSRRETAGNRSGQYRDLESSVTHTNPSSCSATCQKCRDIPHELFTDSSPIVYTHHHSLFALRCSVEDGCCLCWFLERNIARLIHLIKKKEWEGHIPYEHTISLRQKESFKGRERDPRQGIDLYCGKSFSTRIYWSFVEGEGKLPKHRYCHAFPPN